MGMRESLGGYARPVVRNELDRPVERAVLALDGFCACTEFGHRNTEGTEIIDHRLIDKDVAVGKKENAFLASGFPQTPDNLKRSVGFAGAGGHHE